MFRAIVLVTVALGLAAQSLVAVASELHELTRHEASMHGHAAHHAAHDHGHDNEAPAAADEYAGEDGSLHLLLHHTHACTHCAWMTAAPTPLRLHWAPTLRLRPDAAGPVASTARTTPFRPPIRD